MLSTSEGDGLYASDGVFLLVVVHDFQVLAGVQGVDDGEAGLILVVVVDEDAVLDLGVAVHAEGQPGHFDVLGGFPEPAFGAAVAVEEVVVVLVAGEGGDVGELQVADADVAGEGLHPVAQVFWEVYAAFSWVEFHVFDAA